MRGEGIYLLVYSLRPGMVEIEGVRLLAAQQRQQRYVGHHQKTPAPTPIFRCCLEYPHKQMPPNYFRVGWLLPSTLHLSRVG